MNTNARKILVIGSCGAGKSTFARRLGATLKLDVIHLDALYWKPGWVKPSQEEWVQTVKGALKRDAWIIDGNYSGTLGLRLEACEMVIFLDIARWVCLWRVIKRRLMYGNKPRPDMAAGCPEKIDLEFLLWVWNYGRRSRPGVVKLLETNARNKGVVWLQSGPQMEAFLTDLQALKG